MHHSSELHSSVLTSTCCRWWMCVFAPEPLCAAGAEDKDELVHAHPSLTHAILYCILRLKQPNCCFSLYVCRSISNLISVGPHRRATMKGSQPFYFTPRHSSSEGFIRHVIRSSIEIDFFGRFESWSCRGLIAPALSSHEMVIIRGVGNDSIMWPSCLLCRHVWLHMSDKLKYLDLWQRWAPVFQSDIPSLFRWH